MRQTHRTILCGMNDDEKKTGIVDGQSGKLCYEQRRYSITLQWKNKHTKTGNLEQKFKAPRSLLYSLTLKWDSSLFDRWWTLFFSIPIKRSIWLNFKCNSSTAEPFGSSYHSFVHFGASTFHLLLCWLLYKIFTVNCILYVNAQAQMVFSAFLFALGSFKLPDFDSVLFYFIVYKWEFCACKKKKNKLPNCIRFFFPSWLVFPFSICRLSASFFSTSITTVPYTYATSKCTNLCYWNDFSIYLFLGLKKNNEVKTTKAEKSRKILYFIRAQVKDRGQTKRKKKNVNPDALNIFG